jgi:hypothetical protein
MITRRVLECGNWLPLSQAVTCRGQPGSRSHQSRADKSPLTKALTSQRTANGALTGRCPNALRRGKSAAMRIFGLRNLAFPLVAVCMALLLVAGHSGAQPLSMGANAHYPAAQEQDGWTALKTDGGILFVWNRKDLSFSLSVKGNEIRPLDAGENIFFSVDGLPFQIQSLPIINFAPDARKNKLDDKSILLAHRDWEAKFIADELLHQKLTVQSSSAKLANGIEALIWQFDVPKEVGGDAKKQLYVTVVSKDYVILVNSIVNETFSEQTIRQFLLDTMGTLKVSDSRIDVKKLQESIRKGSGP